MYAVIDIETTGGNAARERITEIAVFVYDGAKIVREFQSLINPECNVPPFITRLTGISNEMLRDAPKFFEIARALVEVTEGCTFVAHNAAFDYSFVKQEFKNLGYNYKRPVLCTVKMSRKLLTGYKSYSLGNLCNSLGITITARHRAAGDALATVKLLEILLQNDPTLNQIPTEGLHPLLDKTIFSRLPSTAGIYYFHDEKGKLLYVGKSKNLHNRVLSHFQNSSTIRALEMRFSTASISFTETGSELIALLLESDEIKKHNPLYNRAQRRSLYKYGLYSFTNQAGYKILQIDKIKLNQPALTVYGSFEEALASVHAIVEKYELCQKLCGLYQNKGACFQHSIGKCNGACIGSEAAATYNLRVDLAVTSYRQAFKNMVIFDQGRAEDEYSVVWVENNIYKGFGWVPVEQQILQVEDYKDYIQQYEDNKNIQQIIRSYVKAGKAMRIVRF